MSHKRRFQKTGLKFVGIFAVLLVGALFVLGKTLYHPCANTGNCKESLSLKIENGASGTFEGQKIDAPYIDLTRNEPSTKVLGEEDLTGEKIIKIDLASQTLTAYQGDAVFFKTFVSTGKWYPTPTGDFEIWRKVRATRMTGGSGASYYDLPNVPFVMYFAGSGIAQGRGFALHGAYWHNNFGHPMSHGCVNMRTIDAEKIFGWAEEGTKINIYGKAPL